MKWKKINLKILYTLLFACVFSSGHSTSLNTQTSIVQVPQTQQFRPQDFEKQLERFITTEAGLTAEEATAFFPLFHKFKKEQRKIFKSINNCSKRIEKENLTEAECEKILHEIETLQKQSSQAQSKAMKEWRKIISASKILKVLNADHRFGKHFYRKMTRGNRHHSQKSK